MMMMMMMWMWNEPGPSAVRSDLEHQVKHSANYFIFTTFSANTKKAGQQARARPGVWPYFYFSTLFYCHVDEDI